VKALLHQAAAVLVFVPAVIIQAASGLAGAYAPIGIVAVGLALAFLSALVFSRCLRLAQRIRPSTSRRRVLSSVYLGLVATAVVGVAFVPVALLLRLSGYLEPSLRYSLAVPEQFLYAVALHGATGVGLLLLLPLAVFWASQALPRAPGEA